MATEDILINDGDGFISLSALAAEQVDVKLPIESVDGTVVLSDSSGSLVASTGGVERLTVSDDFLKCSVPIKTPSISGTADNDASVILNGDLTLNNKSGIIWLGSSTNAPAGMINLLVGSSAGDGKNLLISSGQPKTAAEAGSSLSFATVAGDGDRARKTRMFIDPEGNVGINDVSPDERLCVGGNIKANRLKGYDNNPQLIFESQQATLKKGDGSEYVPSDPASFSTKKYSDDKIWVGTTAAYNQISPKLPGTLYCLTD